MTAFEDIVIGKSSIPALGVTIVLMMAIPVVFFLDWRRKHKARTKIRYLIAGAFEECGRYIVLKYIMKKNRTRENAVMYGMGHGGIEILSVLLPTMITYLVVAVMFSKGSIEEALNALKITEDTAAAALPSIQAAAAFDYWMMAMNVLERLFAMFLHIGLTVIVYDGVINAKKRSCCWPFCCTC